MAQLFDTTRNNITIHIENVFKEKELIEIAVCKDSLLTAKNATTTLDGEKFHLSQI